MDAQAFPFRISPGMCGVFVPYGAFLVSPKYIKFSFGSLLTISLSTLIPPTPLSNTPTGSDSLKGSASLFFAFTVFYQTSPFL